MNRGDLSNAIDAWSLIYHLGNTPLGIIIWNGREEVVYWSKQAAQIFEWPEDETLFKTVSELKLIHEDDQEKVSEIMDAIHLGNTVRNHSHNRNYTRSGKVVYCEWFNSALIDDTGDLKNVLSIVLDVTDRKQMEQDLEKSRKQLSLIYNSAIDPMWLISVEGKDLFRFQTINNSFTTVTGLKPEQVIGKLIEEVLPFTSHQLVRDKYNEAINTGKVIDYLEIAVHPAGKKYGEIRVIPIRDNNGKISQLLGIANDITEKQLLNDRLNAEREQLSRKITHAAIKGQELERSKVSRELHDHINQVLTTVKLYTELCSAGAVDIKEYLPKCTSLLNETITEIRDLSKRLSVPSIGEASFYDTLKELVETVNATGKLNVNLDVTNAVCPIVHPELHLTLYRITQEQLTNILKHAEASLVQINMEIEDSQLILNINDNGKGFDLQKKRKGIGITNMMSRAQLLNGSFEIISTPGEGTTAIARIPIEVRDGNCYPLGDNVLDF